MPAVTITFANQKGGVGKTTLTLLAAGLLRDFGLSVAVVDADHQRSCEAMRRKELEVLTRRGLPTPDNLYPIVGANEVDLEAIVNQLVEQHDVVLLDTPGNLRQSAQVQRDGQAVEVNMALLSLWLSDVVIVPLVPSQLDIDSSKESIRLFANLRDKARAQGVHQELLVILNRMSNTTESKELAQLVRGFSDALHIQAMHTQLRHKVEFQRVSTVQPIEVRGEDDPLVSLGRELAALIRRIRQHELQPTPTTHNQPA